MQVLRLIERHVQHGGGFRMIFLQHLDHRVGSVPFDESSQGEIGVGVVLLQVQARLQLRQVEMLILERMHHLVNENPLLVGILDVVVKKQLLVLDAVITLDAFRGVHGPRDHFGLHRRLERQPAHRRNVLFEGAQAGLKICALLSPRGEYSERKNSYGQQPVRTNQFRSHKISCRKTKENRRRTLGYSTNWQPGKEKLLLILFSVVAADDD